MNHQLSDLHTEMPENGGIDPIDGRTRAPHRPSPHFFL